jgi:N-glycosylase/DNA lyase
LRPKFLAAPGSVRVLTTGSKLSRVSRFVVAAPPDFQLATTARSHGWYDLPPFAWDAEAARLRCVLVADGRAHDVELAQSARGIEVSAAPGGAAAHAELKRQVRAMLRLDEDLAPLYALLADDAELGYARAIGAGRLLRAPTAYEDLVKMLCTTNCSWSLTRVMVERLVELGQPAPSGARAFPTASEMAARPERYYRDVVRAGYRAPYLAKLARASAAGTLDAEAWRRPGPSSEALRKQLLELPGIGPYAADNLLRLVGHYGYLGLDSWCRGKLKRLYPRVRNVDRFAERRYRRYGEFRGLAMWLELTRDWHDATGTAAEKFS